MLKGIDTDPSGQLERCKTAFEMREAIDQFANASGVALTASILGHCPISIACTSGHGRTSPAASTDLEAPPGKSAFSR